jgi:hypothetical protein
MIFDHVLDPEEHIETDQLLEQAYQAEFRIVMHSGIIGIMIAAVIILSGC